MSQNSEYGKVPPDFSALSYNEANEAVENEDVLINGEKVKTVGSEYVENILHQLRSGKLSSDNKTLAIYFLGELRTSDTNAINFLIENIDFKTTRIDPINKSRIQILRWSEHPAKEALIRIGKPAVNPILDDLPNENSKLRRSILCEVLREVWEGHLN
jgi:hypothetical protein